MEQSLKKSSRLIDNISSDLFATASTMHRSGVVIVYVEGYEDISFWRGILDAFETDSRKFEISTPIREDLAKGKKVVLGFAPQTGSNLILCVDSDFDYLFGDYREQSRIINSNKYIIQTYVYAIENYMCYAPSLDSIAVKATKNDITIFDFEKFMADYSRTIYPVFVWYAYAAKTNNPSIYPLSDFRNTVRVNFLEVDNNGEQTIEWLERQVEKKLRALTGRNLSHIKFVDELSHELSDRGVDPENVYLYMQGHTLMDYVVKIVLATVCEQLRKIWVERIMDSTREGLTLKNELSYYNNSLRDVDSLLLDNTLFKECEQFDMVMNDLREIFGKENS